MSAKFRFQADWPCCLLEPEQMSLSTRALQALLSLFLFAVVMEEWWWGGGGAKQINSVNRTEEKSIHRLQRKGKLYLEHIKNHFSSIHFAYMTPNYQANHKLS